MILWSACKTTSLLLPTPSHSPSAPFDSTIKTWFQQPYFIGLLSMSCLTFSGRRKETPRCLQSRQPTGKSTKRTLQTRGWTCRAPRWMSAQSHLIVFHFCFLYAGVTVLTRTKSGTGIVSMQAACFRATGHQNLSKHRDGNVSYTVALPGGLTKPADL